MCSEELRLANERQVARIIEGVGGLEGLGRVFTGEHVRGMLEAEEQKALKRQLDRMVRNEAGTLAVCSSLVTNWLERDEGR